MVLSCYNADTVSFINKEGVGLIKIGKAKTGSTTFDTVYIKDNNSVALSSGGISNKCISIINTESKEVMTTIPMETGVYSMAIRGKTIYYCASEKRI